MNHPLQWNLYSLYWLGWLVIGFLPMEIYTLITNTKNTLSYQVWHLEGFYENGTSPTWTAARFFVAAFMLWLLAHFVFNIFR